MIILKSPKEISIMRDAGKIVAECHALIAEKIKPGINTLMLDQMVEKLIRQRGAVPSFKGHHGFPATICVAVNDVICHGFPSSTKLRDGDVVTIDIGAHYKGYHADSAWSYAVGHVSPEITKLMEVTKECLFKGIEQARPGNRVGDIGHAIQQYAESFGYGVIREFCGHGIGQSLWEEPQIPHYGRKNRGLSLKTGMTIAIEPMITNGGWRSKLDQDGWTARTIDGSICVQYEHTIAITEAEPVILTTLD
ncbi:type I methionyl aminopeptidase [Desulforamulus ferrireducens]|uniref:Methionine aminopeptidase n=1 Tax=Desulforamulus ferrireducens TaxID=1833852 RepID=A0A1S6IXC7_9FIRM|nr:type I methionyl aminopeptidase [Desulforamulus ferrireducens]AQS59437.1 type I methionyl aminopeptidase [Desulforamulus ferrireducens]